MELAELEYAQRGFAVACLRIVAEKTGVEEILHHPAANYDPTGTFLALLDSLLELDDDGAADLAAWYVEHPLVGTTTVTPANDTA